MLDAGVDRAPAELNRRFGREPTDEELAEATGIDVARLLDYKEAERDVLSLSTPLGDEGDAEPATSSPTQAANPFDATASLERDVVDRAVDAQRTPNAR